VGTRALRLGKLVGGLRRESLVSYPARGIYVVWFAGAARIGCDVGICIGGFASVGWRSSRVEVGSGTFWTTGPGKGRHCPLNSGRPSWYGFWGCMTAAPRRRDKRLFNVFGFPPLCGDGRCQVETASVALSDVKGLVVVVVGRQPLEAAVKHRPRPSVRFPLQQPHAVFHVVGWWSRRGFLFSGFHLATVFILVSHSHFPLRLPPAGWPDPDYSVHMRRAVGIGSAGDRLSLLAWTCLFLVSVLCPDRGWARGDHDGVAVWW